MPYSHPITGSGLYVTITAADKTSVPDINKTLDELDKIADGKVYQLFDADKITDHRHIHYAAANAYYALETGNNISNTLNVETLLYASTQDQIYKAIKAIGVSQKTRRIAILVVSDTVNDELAKQIAHQLGTLDDNLLRLTPEKFDALKQFYGITETALNTINGDEYQALTSLITEKGALIILKR